MRAWFVVAIVACAPQVSGPHDSVGDGRVAAWDRFFSLVPFQRDVGLPGHTTVALISRAPERWGVALEFGNRHYNPSSEYELSFERSSWCYPYFASHGEGTNFLAHWGATSGTDVPGAAMFGPTTPNHWGLAKAALLADVEINFGRGGTCAGQIVITGVRVLPVAVDDILIELRHRFDAAVSAHEGAFADFERAAGIRNVARAIGVWPTWIASAGELEVTFALMVDAPIDPKRPRFGYGFAVRYAIGAGGAVREVETLAPIAWGTAERHAPPSDALVVTSMTEQPACRGVTTRGPPPKDYHLVVRKATDAVVTLEAIAMTGRCNELTWSTTRLMAGPVARGGTIDVIGADTLSGLEIACPVAGHVADEHAAVLLYRANDVLHSLPVRFEPVASAPCLVP